MNPVTVNAKTREKNRFINIRGPFEMMGNQLDIGNTCSQGCVITVLLNLKGKLKGTQTKLLPHLLSSSFITLHSEQKQDQVQVLRLCITFGES